MIKRKVNISLNSAGIEKACNYIDIFKRDFDVMVYTFILALLDKGYHVANVHLSDARATARSDIRNDDSNVLTVDAKRLGGGLYEATLTFSGDRILFIEFGAGATLGYGHPMNAMFGYGPGTYDPSSPNWDNPNGWWYYNDAGEPRHTYGNRPYAPMYHALEDIIKDLKATAKKYFY